MMDLRVFLGITGIVLATAMSGQAQSSPADLQQLKDAIADLQRRVAALEEQNVELQRAKIPAGASGAQTAAALLLASEELRQPESASAAPGQTAPAAASPSAAAIPSTLPGGATLNFTLDGYYEFNFSRPWDRVNLLRAYDVSSNSFSINQAAVVFELAPDLSTGRRFGARLDFQYGQATATSQGNPANESRPDVWRNVFQAYGTYVVPAGSGVTVDFGKWASSLGIEGNYTKDQMNYSRSYFFNYLPYYHTGLRSSYKVSDRIAANYWLVNGTQQTEDTNGFKDQLFGFVVQPSKSLAWTFNYYLGQEHPDLAPATDCKLPLQPGLCTTPVAPAPNGKLHIFDTYATWQATPKLTLAGEADYVIQREWAQAGPGRSSAPDHVEGGAAYVQYQMNARTALAVRSEYLSDRGGLFSSQTQALKEATATYKYDFADGFDAFLEYRRDWSNRPYFITSNSAVAADHQDTATVGLVWWYGGKQGSW